jgi:Mg-chelatase subunit ChlD
MILKGHELRTGVEQSFNKICAHLGLTHCKIVWCGNATTASISSSRTIYLPNLKDDTTHNRATFNRYVGYIFHELLHHKYTDFTVDSRVGSNPQYLSQLHNAIEDAWIERTAIRSGLIPNALPVLKILVDGIVDQSLSELADWSDPSVYPFALAIHARGFANPVPLADGLLPIFDEASSRIDLARSTADTLEIAQWVYDQLKLPPPKPSNKPTNGDQGEGEPGEQDDKPGEPGQPGGQSPGVRKEVTKFHRAKDVEPVLKAESDEVSDTDYGSDVGRQQLHNRGNHNFDTGANVPGRLRYEVRKMFENSATESFEHNRKAGQLHSGALHKIGHSNRLFKRHHEQAGIESAVVIVLDVSGSMFQRDNKLIKVAVPTCATLCDTLERAGVAVSIVTFNSNVSVLKPFNKRTKQSLESLKNLSGGGGTEDCTAIRFAHNLLFSRPENRKVAFVLTDGVGQFHAVRDQVKTGERLAVTTIGIGICSDVSNLYTNSINIDRVEDLAKSTFNQIKLA